MRDILSERPNGNSVDGLKYNAKEKHWNALDGYTQREVDNWAGNKQIVIAPDANSVGRFIDYALSQNTGNKKLYIGKVDALTAENIMKATGIDLDGYNLALREAEIRKVFTSHGTVATEAPRGQRPVTKEDFRNIVQIITKPDEVILDKKRTMQALYFCSRKP